MFGQNNLLGKPGGLGLRPLQPLGNMGAALQPRQKPISLNKELEEEKKEDNNEVTPGEFEVIPEKDSQELDSQRRKISELHQQSAKVE